MKLKTASSTPPSTFSHKETTSTTPPPSFPNRSSTPNHLLSMSQTHPTATHPPPPNQCHKFTVNCPPLIPGSHPLSHTQIVNNPSPSTPRPSCVSNRKSSQSATCHRPVLASTYTRPPAYSRPLLAPVHSPAHPPGAPSAVGRYCCCLLLFLQQHRIKMNGKICAQQKAQANDVRPTSISLFSHITFS